MELTKEDIEEIVGKLLDKKLAHFKREIEYSLYSLSLEISTLPTKVQSSYEYRLPTDTGLGLGMAIGATPARFNPSYSRWLSKSEA